MIFSVGQAPLTLSIPEGNPSILNFLFFGKTILRFVINNIDTSYHRESNGVHSKYGSSFHSENGVLDTLLSELAG